MIDIGHFLNSKDVACHLREIGYEFTTPEAAFIVNRSRDTTLDEKITAWLEIADTMPDCSMDKRPSMKPIPSFHGFLHDYIDLQKRELERFFVAEGHVFTHSYYEDEFGWQDEGTCFDTAEGCLGYMRAYWNDDVDQIAGFRINRTPVNSPGFQAGVFLNWLERICRGAAETDPLLGPSHEPPDIPDPQRDDWLYLNERFEVTEVDCAADNDEDTGLGLQFDRMWFAFPTPFKRGDIVVDARMRKPDPFVLDYLSSWRRDDFLANGFDEGDRIVDHCDRMYEHHLAWGDCTDMEAYGFGIGEARFSSGSRAWGDVVYRDCMCVNHLDLEYFRGDLADSDRWAAVVSAHLKGEISFDEAADFLHYLRIDAEARQLRGVLDAWYPEEYYPDGVWKRIRREGTWTK